MDWNEASPSPETLMALRAAKDEDFPDTYSATAWKAAFRIMNAVKDEAVIKTLDPWKLPKEASEALKGLDLTGFMVGYACSVLRQMYGATPGKSGAVIELGKGVVDQPAIKGSADSELARALGHEGD